MTNIFVRYPYLFPLFFAAMWFFVTSMIAVTSGWFVLQSRYPNQPEMPIRRWSMASGRLGPLAHYSSCLVLAVCPSGLRIGVWRLFGPFCHDFFVPWRDLRVERLGTATRLVIGSGSTGEGAVVALSVSNWLASQLAEAAGKSWPEVGATIVEPSVSDVGLKLLLQWVLASCAASLFFTFGPRLLGGPAPSMPVAETVLFPTLFFGAAALIKFVVYFARRPPPRATRAPNS